MQANAVAGSELRNARTNPFDYPCNLMPQSQRKRPHQGPPRPVMRVGMANTGRFDFHQNIPQAHWRHFNFLQFQWTPRFD